MTESAGSGTLARGVRAVSGVTLLSRLGGLVRDVVLVRTFGDTAVGSAFAAAFAIPNMFRRLFGEGALSAAFIPEYTRALHGDDVAPHGVGEHAGAGAQAASEARSPVTVRADADRFATLVIGGLGLVTGGLTVVIEIVLLALLLFSNPSAEQRLSIGLIMVMLPFMPLVCMTAIKAGMLQVHGRFGASMSGPLVLNTFIIVVGGYFWLRGEHGGAPVAYVLAVATVLSGLTQLVYFARLLRAHFTWRRDAAGARPRARRMLGKFVPVMIGLGTLQLNAFIDTLIAMWPIWIGPTLLGFKYPLDESSNAIMTFTQRLYQFPLGVFGIAVATAAFPMLSRHANDPHKFLHTIQRGVRLSLFIGLPASVGLALVRHDAVSVLFGFGHNGFSGEGLRRSAAVLLGFAVGIWAYALNHLFTRVFYAQGDMRTPMKVSIAMVALNITLNFTLIWDWHIGGSGPLASIQGGLGASAGNADGGGGTHLFLREAGLAWSTSLCAMVQCMVLLILSRRFIARERLIDAPTRAGVIKIAAATIAMGSAVWLLLPMLGLGSGTSRDGWTQHLVGLCVSVAGGGGVYLAMTFALRCHELRWLASRGE